MALQLSGLGGNKLATLPARFGQMVALAFQKLQFGAPLPARFGQLLALQRLDLGANQLKTLPERDGQLLALQRLDLGMR